MHIDCQRRIKFALDPLNLCNPGKMLPALGHHDAGAGGANALASRL